MDLSIKQKLINNIFPQSLKAIKDIETFPWHKDKNKNIDSYKVQSSQALMIDVFGMLSVSPNKDEIINALFNINDNNWKIYFEYTDSSLLGELTSTQIDVVIEGTKNFILIECKYTEKDGGSCSQINSLKSKNIRQCNGNYEEQLNPVNNVSSNCSLTGKNVNYWSYIQKIYTFSKNEIYKPCPFKGPQYQWMRNLCFAYALKNKTSKNTFSFICYDNADFCEIKKKFDNNYLDKINKNVQPKYHFKLITYQLIIEKGIEVSHDEVWIQLKNWVLNKESQTKKIILSNNKR